MISFIKIFQHFKIIFLIFLGEYQDQNNKKNKSKGKKNK